MPQGEFKPVARASRAAPRAPLPPAGRRGSAWRRRRGGSGCPATPTRTPPPGLGTRSPPADRVRTCLLHSSTHSSHVQSKEGGTIRRERVRGGTGHRESQVGGRLCMTLLSASVQHDEAYTSHVLACIRDPMAFEHGKAVSRWRPRSGTFICAVRRIACSKVVAKSWTKTSTDAGAGTLALGAAAASGLAPAEAAA